MKLLATLAALCLSASLSAQTPFTDPANLRGERPSPHTGRELPIDQGAQGLAQLLRKLNTRASLLNIVAHPDDEDGGMLTLNSRGLGARVADLSLTRGEGGQNAMTGDFEDALGLLRTQELLSNDRYTGVDQFFGTEVDFGFSKTKEEAFAKWTHDRVLYDVVRAIRLYRPLVLTSTWIGGVTDGHGQHQVSGQIAQEAFLAAGDPKVFPELTAQGILPWQPLKIYARVPRQSITDRGLYDYATNQYTPAKFTNYVTGEVSTTPPTADIQIHEGTPDPLLTDASGGCEGIVISTGGGALGHRSGETCSSDGKPLTYIQFARIGLSQQKSQIGPNDRTAPTGAFDVAYHLYGDCTPTPAAALITPPELCHLSSQTPTTAASSQAPTARHITTQPEGLGNAPQNSQRAESPTQFASPNLDPAFFAGIDASINSIAALAPDAPKEIAAGILAISEDAAEAQTLFDPKHPEAIAPQLSNGLKATTDTIYAISALKSLPADQKANIIHELETKKVQFNNALILSLGVTLQAIVEQNLQPQATAHFDPDTITTANPTPGSTLNIISRFYSGEGAILSKHVIPKDFGMGSGGYMRFLEPDATALQPHHIQILQDSIKFNATAPLTKPYFTRPSIEQPFYDLNDPSLRNAPETPAPLFVRELALYNNVEFIVPAIITTTNLRTDHLTHDSSVIEPELTVSLSNHAQVLPASQNSFRMGLHAPLIFLNKPGGVEELRVPEGWTATHVAIPTDRYTGWELYNVVAPEGPRNPVNITGHVELTDGLSYTEGFEPIGYGDLPITNYYTPATTRIVPVDLKLPTRTRIAYLPGTGDAVPEALTSINLQPTILTVADLTATKLAAFDTVILGVRTYAAHPDLHGDPTQALLDFARNGGNVIVQYQFPDFTAADAPYPLDLGSNEKVVDETAPVTLLDPQNPTLTTPNLITPADFNNWVEERGHGFMATWDPHYTALLETHDPGAPSEDVQPQSPQRGGLLTTPLGKGHWTYCAFALYRQLPEAVPGAFRLLANLLNQ